MSASRTQYAVRSTQYGSQWHVVILAGGLGKRLWPLTGPDLPKPLLPLRGGGTLLSMAVERARALVPLSQVWVVTTSTYGARIARALPRSLRSRVIAEPAVRGTATCIAVMTHLIAARDPAAGIIVLPSDHWIAPLASFRATLRSAMRRCAAEPSALACVGIAPAAPATGYGYIHYRGSRVTRFAEKPSRAQAAAWIRRGRVAWNAGMFVGSATAFQTALQRWAPSLARAVETLPPHPGRALDRALAHRYPRLPARSFDRAVLERHHPVTVVRARFRWSDVGSWAAWPLLQQILAPQIIRML